MDRAERQWNFGALLFRHTGKQTKCLFVNTCCLRVYLCSCHSGLLSTLLSADTTQHSRRARSDQTRKEPRAKPRGNKKKKERDPPDAPLRCSAAPARPAPRIRFRRPEIPSLCHAASPCLLLNIFSPPPCPLHFHRLICSPPLCSHTSSTGRKRRRASGGDFQNKTFNDDDDDRTACRGGLH